VLGVLDTESSGFELNGFAGEAANPDIAVFCAVKEFLRELGLKTPFNPDGAPKVLEACAVFVAVLNWLGCAVFALGCLANWS
jgi:hypothetical protein